MGLMNINIFINKIEFGIYKIINQKTKYILKDEIVIPKSFSVGERLSYIRKMISVLVKEYGVRKAYMNIEGDIGIEIIEAVKVEGIIEELFSICGVELCK